MLYDKESTVPSNFWDDITEKNYEKLYYALKYILK